MASNEEIEIHQFIIKLADGEIKRFSAAIKDGGWLSDIDGNNLNLKIGQNENGVIIAPILDDD